MVTKMLTEPSPAGSWNDSAVLLMMVGVSVEAAIETDRPVTKSVCE